MENEELSSAIFREAKNLINSYGFSERTHVSYLNQSENKVFLIADPDRSQKYVIRVNSGRLKYHNALSVASEMTWIMAIHRDTDIVVPEVLKASDGSLVQTINAPDLDKPRHAVVYSFLDGVEPPEDDLVSGFERLGEISAHMHLHAKSWTPPDEFIRHTWSPDLILDDGLDWGAWQNGVNVNGDILSLLCRLENVIRKRLEGFPVDSEHFGLIHADLRLANLLVEGDQTAIIDFDDCGFGWYLFDLATALSFLEERSDVPQLVKSWLNGYRKIGHISMGMENEFPTLMMLRRLQLIGWLGYQQHHLEFARDIGTQFTIDSCRLAENYLKQFA